jgi:cytochrome c553
MQMQMSVFLTVALVVEFGIAELSFAQSNPSPQQSMPSIRDMSGQKLAEADCAGCHGADGNSADPRYPKIAGQKDYYLREQLGAFKSGTRRSDIMSAVVSAMPNSQIVELARYYSRQPVKLDVVKDLKLADIGARIFRYPTRGVPACALCHVTHRYGPGFGPMGGMRGGGMMMGRMGMTASTAIVPNLFGQHANYIVEQLDAFAAGERQSAVMGPIAAALSEWDRVAVAEFLSGIR